MSRRALDETGEAAAIEMMGVIGFLLLPALIFLIQIPGWVDARSTAELAAQEAARQVVLSPDLATGFAAGDAIARQIVTNHGFEVSAIESISYTIDPPGTPVPGQEFTVTAFVRMETPPIVVPFVGSLSIGPAYTGEHVELFDVYRES